MAPEDVGAVPAFPEPREPVARIAREREDPAHHLGGVSVELIVPRCRREDRQPASLGDVRDAFDVGRSGQQRERAHVGMTPGEPDGLRHAAAGARRADSGPVHARLRDEELERRIDVGGPRLADDALRSVRSQRVEALTSALAEPPVIHGQRMNPRGRELRRQRGPCGARCAAHVEQEHRRPRRRGGMIGGLQQCAIRGCQGDFPGRHLRLREPPGVEDEQSQNSRARNCHRCLPNRG